MRILRQRIADTHLSDALAGSAVSFAMKILSAGSGVALAFLIARRFGASGSGTWVLANTVLQIAGYVALCGMDFATTRAMAVYTSEHRWDIARAWTTTGVMLIAGVGGAVTAGLLIGRTPIARSLSESPDFLPVMTLFALAIIPYALLRLAACSFRGMRRFALADALESGLTTALLVVAILAFSLSQITDLATYFLAISTVVALAGLGAWIVVLKNHKADRAPLMYREALSRSLPMAGTILGVMATPWIVTIFLAGAATTAEVGVYRVSLQFALLLSFLPGAVETGLSPQIAALHSQGRLNELVHSAKRLTLLLAIVGGIPSLILMIFASAFLSIFGPEFPQGATAMRILISAQIINLATGPSGSFMDMTGLARYSFINAVIAALGALLISFLMIPHFGIVGAACAAASATIYRNIMAAVVLWRRRGLFLPLGIVRTAARA